MKISRFFLVTLFLFILSFCLLGCSIGHRCDHPAGVDSVIWEESPFPKKKSVSIGNNHYLVTYDCSQISSSTREISDTYRIFMQPTASQSRFPVQSITLERDTGRVVGFRSITPFPAIENAASRQDGELQAIAELYLRELVDFTQFNSFSVTREEAPNEGELKLYWTYKKDGVTYDRGCRIRLDADGKIYSFELREICPRDLSPTFLSEKRQIRLLEKKICKLVDEPSIRYCHYEIKNKTLTLEGGKPAMIYYFHATDRDGFGWLYIMAIS